ncbi:HAD family hydrolase [Erysipelotrichaceae bacterium RD49]|nr:HAD family hydrolase [Erysipelotrichaceae bacterium RD49]
MIKALFFDLDGSLLGMDLDAFTHGYLKSIAGAMMPHGFDPETLIRTIYAGIGAMADHDPAITNEQAFMEVMKNQYGLEIEEKMPYFEEYYRNGFGINQQFCPQNPLAGTVIDTAKKFGLQTILATNPIFPRVAVDQRLNWAGLKPEDFEWITSYENSHFCKPDPRYFLEIADQLALNPEEVLMVGNDLNEDYGAIKAGMDLFVLTDYLIDSGTNCLEDHPHGTMEDLLEYIAALNA